MRSTETYIYTAASVCKAVAFSLATQENVMRNQFDSPRRYTAVEHTNK